MGFKIHVNMSLGLLEVEGTEEFAERIYEKFADSLKSFSPKSEMKIPQAQIETESVSDEKAKQPNRSTKRAASSPSTKKTSFKLKVDPDLKLDKKKLEDFVGQFKVGGHSQKIVIFAKYLEQEHGIAPCTAEQIATCYKLLKLREPVRWQQSFVDARAKNSYIEYTDLEHIELSIIGENFFNHDLERVE